MKAIVTKVVDEGFIEAFDAAGNKERRSMTEQDIETDHKLAAKQLVNRMGWAPVALASGTWASGQCVHVLLSPELPEQRDLKQYWIIARTEGGAK